MLKFKQLVLSILIVLIASIPVQADVITALGTPDSNGDYVLEIDHNRNLEIHGAFKHKYTRATTSMTISTTQSGTIFVTDSPPSAVLFTLPDADVGLEYTFIAGDDNKINIDVQDTDFFLIDNTISATTYAAGDATYSQGYTADALHLLCAKDLYWYAVDKVGTWTDNGSDPIVP